MPSSPRVVPPHLEEVFLVRGPAAFDRLIICSGGKIRASAIAGVSSSTMSRWVQSPPGILFGPRRDMRSYRSLWFGYPSPLPGLDRIIEEICGENQSFLGRCIDLHGLEGALEQIRSPEGFQFDEVAQLDLPSIAAAMREIGFPAVTSQRWRQAVRYPRQWVALDNLALSVDQGPWISTVLWPRDAGRLSRKVSPQGIACMVQSVLPKIGL